MKHHEGAVKARLQKCARWENQRCIRIELWATTLSRSNPAGTQSQLHGHSRPFRRSTRRDCMDADTTSILSTLFVRTGVPKPSPAASSSEPGPAMAARLSRRRCLQGPQAQHSSTWPSIVGTLCCLGPMSPCTDGVFAGPRISDTCCPV